MLIERNTIYLQQADPAGGQGGPSAGTPAPAAPSAPAAPAAGESQAPAAGAGHPTETPPAAGTPATADASPAVVDPILSAAQNALGDLETALVDSSAGIPGQAPPLPVAPAAPRATPEAIAAPPAAPSPARFTMTPEQRKEFYARYSAADLNDEQSVGLLLEEATNLAIQQIQNAITSPATLNRVVASVREDAIARSRTVAQVQKTIQSVESWWKRILPEAKPEHLWAFVGQASQAHPIPANGTPEQARKTQSQQAYFCVQQYLAIRGHQPNPANETIARDQGHILPGSGGAPTGGAPTGAGAVMSFHEQLRSNRAR